LAKALRWTIQELEQATGVDLGYSSWDALEENMLRQARIDGSLPPNLSNVTHVTLTTVPVYALTLALVENYTKLTPVSYIEVLPEVARQPHRVTFLMDGDSMAPTMNAGDAIHIDTSEMRLEDGRVYVVGHEDAAQVKRARVYGGGALWLISDNTHSDEPPLAAEAVSVVGRVFAVSPQMKRL
jgi:repressor LexA